MLTDNQTNFLYLPDSLPEKYPEFYQRLENLFQENQISFAVLPNTKDIWAVDYMPIQISENKFVQFKYDPDYLKFKKYAETISNVDYICDSLKMLRTKSDIILDGGNVIKSKNKVILCDKIFEENPTYSRKDLGNKLKELFEVEKLYIIPQQPGDIIGHADGMLRFLDENTVLINDLSKEKNKIFERSFKTALDNAELDYIEIPYNPYNNQKSIHANGIYINYIEMKDIIILPVFDMKEDVIAIQQFKRLFPENKILPIESNEIAYGGGVLNCISWNIYL